MYISTNEIKNMTYPKIIKNNGKTYKYIRKYNDYALYIDNYGFRECFNPHEIYLIRLKQINKR